MKIESLSDTDGLELSSMPVRDVPPRATLESLPDELILKIVKKAAVSDNKAQEYRFWTRSGSSTPCPGCRHGTCAYDHDFVANVVSELSTKFNRIARDASLWRDDRTMMVYIRHGSASICSLPDNLVLKIVKMAAESREMFYLDHTKFYPCIFKYDHDFITDSIARISQRFMRIASHPDLWKDNVSINYPKAVGRLCLQEDAESEEDDWQKEEETGVDGQADHAQLTDLFPNDVTESFSFREYGERVPEEYIGDILDNCPNLKVLTLYDTELPAWPGMALSGYPLQELYVASCVIDAKLFKDINMSVSLPNLKVFFLSISEDQPDIDEWNMEDGGTYMVPSILLPDISECNKLQILKISNGYFRFPGNLEGKHPLPNNLEKLTLDDVQFGDRGSKDMNPMRDLTSMCPNLKMLAYKAKDHNWPSSTPAWSLLEELYLDYQDEYTFRDVELHRYLPNLKTFFLTNYWESMLPDMRGCDKLEHVHLHTRYYVPIDPRVEMPFPKTLKKLTGLNRYAWFQYGYVQVSGPEIMEFMRKHLPECEVVEGWDEGWEGFSFKIPERDPGSG